MRFLPRVSLLLILILCSNFVRSEDQHKRAPSGFTGVRGKKSITEGVKAPPFYEDDADEVGSNNGGSPQLPVPASELQFPSDINEMPSKRAPSMGFVGMRGKKPWEDRLAAENGGLPKRAPNGFFGMRGKKNGDLDALSYDLEKRVNSGFFGMRGKKGESPYFTGYLSDKRAAPSMGFVGMRGRKSFVDPSADFEKRTPSGFFGMRGKKWGLFGLRGKKIPYQFRGKFVGVRGKKDQVNGDDRTFETDPSYELDMNQLMMQLMEGYSPDKTAADGV